MFCYQCQETNKNQGCTIAGVCGKKGDAAELMDLYIHLMRGISALNLQIQKTGKSTEEIDKFIVDGLFSTITNTNFNKQYFLDKIVEALDLRDQLKEKVAIDVKNDALDWYSKDESEITNKAKQVGVMRTKNDDIRSLRELLTYGLKGMSAYYHHAYILGEEDSSIPTFIQEALVATLEEKSIDELTQMVLKCGEMGVKTLALLDKANTKTYGNPEPTKVFTGVRDNPGILISGHDLKDLEELLNQTEGTGIDVYTHGEMLPANAYPALKKYKHFVGNYGRSWWHQKDEFEKFNGPILLTTNCLVPPKESYKHRIFTTGVVGFEGLKHIPNRQKGGSKDFSEIIELAKTCNPPEKLEEGEITIGFAHNTLIGASDKILEMVRTGKIKKFVVMAGCDGRHKEREYYRDFAQELPNDTVILTAGCAKYQYNKLNLGDIEGIPRIIDAGQCNDSYSLVVIATKLAEILGVDINELPIVYNIAWYEQKAVLVLLALLSLGVKNITLGPTIPAFISSNVLNILIENFNISPNSTVENDMNKLVAGIPATKIFL
jgi:hydroxylamine reductase